MKDVHLEHLNLNPKNIQISGGEAQRVALKINFFEKSSIILADEPTASLDPDNAQEIMDLIRSLKIQNRIIIIATHNQVLGTSRSSEFD